MGGKNVLASAVLAIALFLVVQGAPAGAEPGQAAQRDACSGQNCTVTALSYGRSIWKFPPCVGKSDGGLPDRYGWAIYDLDSGVQRNCQAGDAGWVAVGAGGGSSGASYWYDGGGGMIFADPWIRNPDGGALEILGVAAASTTASIHSALMIGTDNYIGGLNISPALTFGSNLLADQSPWASIYSSQQTSGGMSMGLNLHGGGPNGFGAVGISVGTTPGTGATPIAQFYSAGIALPTTTANAIDFRGLSYLELRNSGLTTATANATTPAVMVRVLNAINATNPEFVVCHGAGCAFDFSVPFAAPSRAFNGITIGENTAAAAPITWTGRPCFVSDGGTVAANSFRNETMTIAGAVQGADCITSNALGLMTVDLETSCGVTAAGTVTFRFDNATAGVKTPDVTTYCARIFNP